MSKQIVIIGAGVVGMTCARRLSADGHDVVMIERDGEKSRELLDRLDIQVVTGNGCALPVLKEARLDSADLLLAVTDSDEVNMIASLIAGASFDVPTKVIRLRHQDYLENLPDLTRIWSGQTHAINPDQVAARRILSLIHVPEAVDVAELLGGRVLVAAFRIARNSPLAGKTLRELPRMFPRYRFLIPVIYRAGRALLPGGESAIEPGDIAYFSSEPEGIINILRMMGRDVDRLPRLVIGGGGNIGRLVARGALEQGHSTTILHRNRQEAEKLAVELPDAFVIHGDILDESMLAEAGIERTNTFIAATNDQETNLLSAVLAKRMGCPRTIPLVDNTTYLAVAEGMGVDAVVSPRLASVSEILRFVRGTHFEEVASLPHEAVEISVIEVDERSPLADRPLRELKLPDGVIFAAVATPDRVFVPGGDDRIPRGSRAVVFVLAEASEKFVSFVEDA
ncbi:MAG: Trk system potassium transporter TrkA [Acidobacteriota bacterium]|nr:Trk system potassium transporter TrkA [Acidobacteriota bacterium]MDQ7086955.1 Trk system potassium transporter TrkA [Acidobacteriota bacterium]